MIGIWDREGWGRAGAGRMSGQAIAGHGDIKMVTPKKRYGEAGKKKPRFARGLRQLAVRLNRR